MIAQPRSAGRAALRVLRVAGAGAMVCALGLLPGCGTRAAQPLALGNDPPPPAADPLKQAMPTKDDFSPDWHVQEQDERTVALPGMNDTGTVFSAIAPARCQQFAAGFVSAPG